MGRSGKGHGRGHGRGHKPKAGNTDTEPYALESEYFSQLDLNFVSMNKDFLSTIIAYLGTPNTLLVSLNSNLSTVFAEFYRSEFWKNFNIINALNIAVVTLNKNGVFHIVAEAGQVPSKLIMYMDKQINYAFASLKDSVYTDCVVSIHCVLTCVKYIYIVL